MNLEKVQPEAVLHLAALSNPNFCETHQGESKTINVESTIHLAHLCKDREIPFLFTSTDLVFDGRAAPYQETDDPNPLMAYGKHKAEAERLVSEIYPKAIIARLPVLFGNGGFMMNWVKTLKAGGNVSAFRDEFRSLVSARAAAEGLFLLLDQKVSGIWHLGGKERISRYEFAVKMAEAYELPVEKIIPSLRKDVQMPAARPEDVSLDSKKAFNLGYHPLSVAEELKLLINY